MENNKRGFTLNRHAEKSLLSIPTTTNNTQGRDPEQKLLRMALCKGFTLIELLIVVLIIGILSAIAVPQYQRAVLKSRFSALMPIAKSIANGNEVYYMEHGSYATSPANLDVAGQATYADGTALALGNNLDYAYVLASRPDANNRYIVYQHHSVNFPNEAHCEALDNNTQAVAVCQSLGFTKDKGHILSDTYTTYTQEGDGNGMAPGVRLLASLSSCALANSKTGFTCTSTINDNGTATKEVCNTTEDNQQVCFKTVYNADGSYLQYGTKSTGGVNTNVAMFDKNGRKIAEWEAYTNQITPRWSSGYIYSYDGNGDLTAKMNCSSIDANTGQCNTTMTAGFTYQYTNGKITSIDRCGEFDTDGNCSHISWNTIRNLQYDENDNLVSYVYSDQTYTLTYDDDNNLLYSLPSKGNWDSKSLFVHNEDGTGIYSRLCANDISANGSCDSYYDSANNKFYFGSVLDYLSAGYLS